MLLYLRQRSVFTLQVHNFIQIYFKHVFQHLNLNPSILSNSFIKPQLKLLGQYIFCLFYFIFKMNCIIKKKMTDGQNHNPAESQHLSTSPAFCPSVLIQIQDPDPDECLKITSARSQAEFSLLLIRILAFLQRKTAHR